MGSDSSDGENRDGVIRPKPTSKNLQEPATMVSELLEAGVGHRKSKLETGEESKAESATEKE